MSDISHDEQVRLCLFHETSMEFPPCWWSALTTAGLSAAVEYLKQFGKWLFPEPGCDQRASTDHSVVMLPLLATPTSP